MDYKHITCIYISKSTRHAYEQIIFIYLSQGLHGDVASIPVYGDDTSKIHAYRILTALLPYLLAIRTGTII